MNILAKSKIGVMKTFLVLMRSVPTHLGGLKLQSLEVEGVAQAIHGLISLCAAKTLTNPLLKTIAEYYQLKLGTD